MRQVADESDHLDRAIRAVVGFTDFFVSARLLAPAEPTTVKLGRPENAFETRNASALRFRPDRCSRQGGLSSSGVAAYDTFGTT